MKPSYIKTFFSKATPLWIASLLSIFYWIYVGFISQMVIVYDSIGYEYCGKIIYEKGWIEYLKTGPNREPLYPFLISLSMQLADHLSISYQSVQKFLQLSFLFLSQIISFFILKKLNIRPWLITLTLLYLGFSPSLVNSSLRLFSEIAAYPFMLGIALMGGISWQYLLTQSTHQNPNSELENNPLLKSSTSEVFHPGGEALPVEKAFLIRSWGQNTLNKMSPQTLNPVIMNALLLGFLFVLMTFIKGLFELIFFLFILPFMILLVKAFINHDVQSRRKAAVFLLVLILSYQIPVFLYKSANKKYNGHYTLAESRVWALYGNTARRVEPLTQKRFLTALAYAAGSEFCQTIYDFESCQYWSYTVSDELGVQKRQELDSKKMNIEQRDKELLKLSFQKALGNPVQYILLFGIEYLKMFFWECQMMGLATYPDLIEWALNFPPIVIGMGGLLAILTLLATIFQFSFLWRQRFRIFNREDRSDESLLFIFSIFVLIHSFMILYSFFFTVPRYIYPLAPLYLILIAFFIEKVLTPKAFR